MSDKIPHAVIISIGFLVHQKTPQEEYLPISTHREDLQLFIECDSENECKKKIEEIMGKFKEIVDGEQA